MTNADADPRAGGSGRARAAALAPPVAVAVVVFCVALALTVAFNRAGALRLIDLLFDADSGWFLRGFRDGTGTGTAWGARSLVHPNPANFVNPIVRLASHLSVLAGWGGPPEALREGFALTVAPLFVALESAFVYLACRNLFRSASMALLVSALNLTLLPTFVFGAIPESFAMSGCGFAALLYLVSRTATGRPLGALPWGVVGVFLTGVTTTNIAPFALAHALTVNAGEARWQNTIAKTARMCLAVTACTVAIAVTIAGALGALGDYRHTEFQQLAEVRAPRELLQERRWLASAADQAAIIVSRALVTFPMALGHSVLAPEPTVDRLAVQHDEARSRNPLEASVRISFRNRGADWGTFVTLAVLAGAVMALVRIRTPSVLLYRVAAMLLGFNWAFHSVFGVELFLYSKHWTLPLVFLLAAVLDDGWFRRPIGVAVLGMLIVLAAVRSAGALALIIAVVS